MGSNDAAVKKAINKLIAENKIMVFSKSYCPYCTMAKKSLDALKVDYEVLELDKEKDGSIYQSVLAKMTGARSVPRVFVKSECIGGGEETVKLQKSGELLKKLNS